MGTIVILFDQSDGATPTIENGFNVYKMPEDGLLKLNTKAVYDIDEQIFYYVDSKGERTKIEYLYPTSQKTSAVKNQKTFDEIPVNDKTVYVMGGEMGSFNSKNGVVRFRSFEVGIASDSEKLVQQTRNKITEIQKGISK